MKKGGCEMQNPKPKRCELQIKAANRDGRWIYKKSMLDPDLQGRPACRTALVDIEKHKQAEQEQDALKTHNRHTRKPESLGGLAGGIAHNFNNILQAILGNAELALINSPQDSPAKDYLTSIMKQSQRAGELCRQMLAYAGKGNLMIQPLDVSALVAEMIPLLKGSISGKAALHYRFANNLPSINGDATQIRQLIMNLVINAFEAIGEKEGLVSLTVDTQGGKQPFFPGMLPMENLAESKFVVVEVRDTGCGMNPVIRDRIFEPFYTTKFTGHGLGLAAAAGIAQAHGGDIRVYSRPGRGSSFSVFLPVA
jgi:signal transduction histidine kinase